jgi:signal transduction histidine kinase/CheY-like chemotaxis protein/HAMP domain-containing protein
MQQAVQQELALLRDRQLRSDEQFALQVRVMLGMLIAGIAMGAYAIFITRRLIVRPLIRLTALTDRIAGGDTAVHVPMRRWTNEIGALARGLENFREVKLAADGDVWTQSQLNQISAALRDPDSEDAFAHILIGRICEVIQVGYGAYFGNDESVQKLVLRARYGYLERSDLPTEFKIGEGLVGQCAADAKPLLLHEVPTGYVQVMSGIGQLPPRHLALYPLISGQGLKGVIELGTFERLKPEQLRLLEILMRESASRLDAIHAADQTQQLLAQSRAQTEELRASDEELRAINEALHEKNRLLREQRQRAQESEAALTAQAEELRAANEELEETGRILNESNVQLDQARRTLQQKADELARTSKYKSEFLANMSHELRTPLNSILILAKTLGDNEQRHLDADEIESAQVIHDSGSHLLTLINDILDLSKVEAGKMDVIADDLVLADLLSAAEQRFRPIARQRNLDWRIEREPGLPVNLVTDGPKFQQIVNNLLSNAFKFTEAGGVVLRVALAQSPPASVPTLRPGESLLLEVTDTGIGIPADKLEKIFAPFEQVDTSTSRRYGGTGLGLAISVRMAQLLGGELTVDSVPGQGSCFCLFLPFRFAGIAAPAPADTAVPDRRAPGQVAAVAVAAATPAASPAANPAADCEQGSILIVEDDESFARVLARVVSKRGFRPLLAHTAVDGLAQAQQLPHAILLDLTLPDLDGWTVLQRLKADPATRHIPVHVVSAQDETSRGAELGAVGFLRKPVTKEALDGALDRVLRVSAGPLRRILLVGVDQILRDFVGNRIESATAEAAGVASGTEGLARLAQQSCDCLVVNLDLADMSGFDFLDRAAAQGPLPPVVVYSERELDADEVLRLRTHTASIVVRGTRARERLLDEVTMFLHSLNSPAGRTATLHVQTEAADLAGKTVLVVDDDMRNVFALSKVLRARGLNVLMAQDGPKALAQLEQREGKVDWVLMDVMMPGMDGYETTRRIRSRPDWGAIPVIAVTAKAMPGDREKCLLAGANDYLSKPIDVDKLLSMMRAWVGPQA